MFLGVEKQPEVLLSGAEYQLSGSGIYGIPNCISQDTYPPLSLCGRQ